MTRDGRDLIVFLLLTVLLMGGIMILKPGQGTLPAADVTTTATPKQQANKAKKKAGTWFVPVFFNF